MTLSVRNAERLRSWRLMKRFELYEYVNAGCMQVTQPNFFIGSALHILTSGKICDDCPYYEEGKCDAYKKMIGKYKAAPKAPTYAETVREEAKRRGISIKQVRRERRDAINQAEAGDV